MASIVWFRRDLRIEDNPALLAGVRAGPVFAVFIWAPEEEGHYQPGRVSRWWLKHSLAHLDSSLRSLGTCFITKRSSDSVSSLLEVVKSTGATQLFFNHLYDPISLVRDHRAKEVLTAHGVTVRSFNADLLYEPWDVTDDNGHPFTTFSAFWEKCLSMPLDPEAPLLPPKRIVSGYSGLNDPSPQCRCISGCGYGDMISQRSSKYLKILKYLFRCSHPSLCKI